MWWHDGPDGWGWVWMGLMMAIVWLPLLVILVWALRQFGQPPQPPAAPPRDADRASGAEPDALELARRSYARGELDRERYLQIIEDLGQQARPNDG